MTVTREKLAEQYPDADLLFADGLDHALIGVCLRFGQEPIALYDRRKVIEGYLAEGLTHEEAEDHFAFTVIGAWGGDATPAFAVLV